MRRTARTMMMLLSLWVVAPACDHHCADLEKKVCEGIKDKRRCKIMKDEKRRELLSDEACERMLKAIAR